jgi:hypothetical protein
LSRTAKNCKLWPADESSAGLETMNQENIHPDPGASDARLGALLRSARGAPGLPPRFREGVWRRIEESAAPAKVSGDFTWLDALVAMMLRPRLALATVAVLVVAGALLGVRDGNQMAHRDAQARYLAAVAPNSLR